MKLLQKLRKMGRRPQEGGGRRGNAELIRDDPRRAHSNMEERIRYQAELAQEKLESAGSVAPSKEDGPSNQQTIPCADCPLRYKGQEIARLLKALEEIDNYV